MSDSVDPVDTMSGISAELDGPLGRIMGGMTAESVFGVERTEHQLVITAAAFERAGGFGFGGSSGGDGTETGVGGGGGGGGGSAVVRPVAVIEVRPEGVRVQPVLDFTKIGITVAMAAIAAWRAIR